MPERVVYEILGNGFRPTRLGGRRMRAERDECMLIERAQQGDEAAFAELFETHKVRVFNVIFNVLRDRDDAEEETLEVFLKAWKRLDSYDYRSTFSAWLHAITVRHYLNVLRHRSRRVQTDAVSERLMDGGKLDELFERLFGEDGSPHPVDQLIRQEWAAVIRGAVAALPERLGSVIGAFYFEESTETEVSAALGLPLGTVRSRKAEGLKKLRQLLEPYMDEDCGGGEQR